VSELAPLEVLFERDDLPRVELPAGLRRLYGGDLGFPESCVYANFVETLDGVVAIPSLRRSNRLISDEATADLFGMALLRAFAEAVVVGSGTLLASPNARWLPESAFSAGAADFAALRADLGLPPAPQVVLVTASGTIDPAAEAIREGALVVTTERGAVRLRDRLPAEAQPLVVPGDEEVDVAAAFALLRARGYGRILTEGGPTLFGSLLSAGVVDELFLTVSPLLAGRSQREGQLAMVEGAELLPTRRLGGELLSVRTHGDHLFLRYALQAATPIEPDE
jgi:riboflavin biosynthesis pyrimidine reductase